LAGVMLNVANSPRFASDQHTHTHTHTHTLTFFPLPLKYLGDE
jgi:hypothetical protein